MKYAIVDMDNNEVYFGDSLEKTVDEYEASTDFCFRTKQGKRVFMIEMPEPLEVTFKVQIVETPVVLNKGRK